MQRKARVVHQRCDTTVRLFDCLPDLFLLDDNADDVVQAWLKNLAVLIAWEVSFFELVTQSANHFELGVEVVLALFFYEFYAEFC